MWVKIERNTNYSVNEIGEVRNDCNMRIKTPTINKANGYFYIDLYKDNKSIKVPLHRLVAEAFIPNPENKPTVDHLDGNRTNNSVNNLRWATYKEQNSRFDTNGVRSEQITVLKYNEYRKKRGGGHLSWGKVIEVFEFNSITETSELFNCTIGNISLMLKNGSIGMRGRTRGYQFLYKNGKRAKHNS